MQVHRRSAVKNQNAEKMLVRLPHDIKAWIVAQAERNCASQNSEIVRALRYRMDMAAVEDEFLTELESLETAERSA